MARAALTQEPEARIERSGDEIAAKLSGSWTAEHSAKIESLAAEFGADGHERRLIIDLSGVRRLDTLGAWVLDRTRHEVGSRDMSADFVNASPEQQILLNEVAYRGFQEQKPVSIPGLVDFFVDIGKTVSEAWRDMVNGTAFLGELLLALLRVMLNPRKFRGPSLVNQIEQVACSGVPIIVLISFLVGCIVAQQGIFQLSALRRAAFVVNLIGILILRELGVLLTSIMVAGRSGSAFTAEIGSMKMREEIDALRVMGLDPIEVLIVPRILALIIGLPILTFIASIAALVGGGLRPWLYGGIDRRGLPARASRRRSRCTRSLVGLIKAPFMALIIGIIATIEGLEVEGSAELLGRHVTASVVKSIFMVIVLDGLFAMFFAAIEF